MVAIKQFTDKYMNYVYYSCKKGFGFIACPTFLYEGREKSEQQKIMDAYYKLHCIELGIF